MPNNRVPLLPETHENEVCHSKACVASVGNAQDVKAPYISQNLMTSAPNNRLPKLANTSELHIRCQTVVITDLSFGRPSICQYTCTKAV
eukprot:10561289-Heterocapsa_arctica.AAC.1